MRDGAEGIVCRTQYGQTNIVHGHAAHRDRGSGQRTETAEQAETLVIKHLAAKEAERCAASDLVASTSKDGDIAINQAKSADERSDGFANEALLCRSCNTGCAAL